jgi:hypothetical protein
MALCDGRAPRGEGGGGGVEYPEGLKNGSAANSQYRPFLHLTIVKHYIFQSSHEAFYIHAAVERFKMNDYSLYV